MHVIKLRIKQLSAVSYYFILLDPNTFISILFSNTIFFKWHAKWHTHTKQQENL
jgi:hypothetical protein